MSVSWYLNRLRSMSAPELLHRVREKGLKLTARNRLEGWDRYPPLRVRSPFRALTPAIIGAGPVFRERAIRAADEAVRGHFSALGLDWPAPISEDPYPETLWTLDPVTGGRWPGSDTYCFDIPYRHERSLGDVKYVWELNRLQSLQPLAVAGVLTGDPVYVRAAERMVLSWFAANPPFRGLAWASGIEVSIRAISLLVLSGLLGPRLCRPAGDAIGAILSASLLWLDRFPSRFSSANNHKVAEDAALYLLSLALPSTPERGRLLRCAARELDAEALRQILPDGAPAEQSPTYGAFTAEFLLVCDRLGRNGPRPLSPVTRDRLARLSDFLITLSDPGGNCPRIGDDDEGRVITLTLPEPDYALNVARLICGAGRTGCELRDLLPRPEPGPFIRSSTEPVLSFPRGGYTRLAGECGGRQLTAILDHGPLGYLSIAAHGHADALSLLLSIDGRPILVDPGTYLYHSGGAWRDWFRSTRAHNTLTLGGADQSRMSGAFNWASRAGAHLLEATGSPMRVTGAHDGYRGRFGVDHQRQVRLERRALIIEDRLLGRGRGAPAGVQVELVFQLHEALSAAETGGGAVMVTDERGGRVCLIRPPSEGRLQISRGGQGHDGGWVSPRFGVRVPATRISWHGHSGQAPHVTEVIPC
jgi:hypothetical protein